MSPSDFYSVGFSCTPWSKTEFTSSILHMVSLNILKDFRSHPCKSSVPHSEIRGNPNSFRKFIKLVFFNFLKFLSFKTSSSSFMLLFKHKHRIRYNPHPQVSMSVSPESNKSKSVCVSDTASQSHFSVLQLHHAASNILLHLQLHTFSELMLFSLP